MVKGFFDDLKQAKKAERIVLDVLNNTTDEYDFYDVSNDRAYWHKGDIEVYDYNWCCHYYIDVKDDGVIATTGNFLAEDYVYYSDSKQKQEGFMRNSTYDYIAYVSQADHMIYILDFERWKKYYRSGYQKNISHYDSSGNLTQRTYGYLMPKYKAREYGIIVAEINYKDDNGVYVPVNIKEVAAS